MKKSTKEVEEMCAFIGCFVDKVQNQISLVISLVEQKNEVISFCKFEVWDEYLNLAYKSIEGIVPSLARLSIDKKDSNQVGVSSISKGLHLISPSAKENRIYMYGVLAHNLKLSKNIAMCAMDDIKLIARGKIKIGKELTESNIQSCAIVAHDELKRIQWLITYYRGMGKWEYK